MDVGWTSALTPRVGFCHGWPFWVAKGRCEGLTRRAAALLLPCGDCVPLAAAVLQLLCFQQHCAAAGSHHNLVSRVGVGRASRAFQGSSGEHTRGGLHMKPASNGVIVPVCQPNSLPASEGFS